VPIRSAMDIVTAQSRAGGNDWLAPPVGPPNFISCPWGIVIVTGGDMLPEMDPSVAAP
jgi:hypothetical protein